MRRFGLVLLCLSLLSACVTEKTFIDSKKQVRNLEFDKTDAAITRLTLGLSYLQNSKYEQAKYNLERALEYAPKRADVNYSMGYYYQKVGEMTLAEKYFLNAINYEPDNPDTHNNYGTFLCNVGQLEKAEKSFQKAIDISKYTRAAESYENMAICALANESLSKAEHYFEMSYKHNPSRSNIVLSLAGIKYASGDLVSAIDYYGRYLRLNQISSRGLLLGYLINDKRGRISQSQKYARQLKSEYPNSSEAMHLTQGQLHKSEFESLRIKYLFPNSKSVIPKIKISKKPENKVNSFNTTPYRPLNLAGVLPQPVLPEGQTPEQFVTNLNNKVKMFSVPLTDSEKIDLLEAKKSSVTINKEAALPSETVLVTPVSKEVLVNDRVATAKQKRYLQPKIPDFQVPSYIAKRNNNLYQVSMMFNVKITKLITWNKLKKEQLTQGQKLYVADPSPLHTTNKEQMLSTLAEELNIKLSALLKWNKLKNDGWLRENTDLFIVDPSIYLTEAAPSNIPAATEEKSFIIAKPDTLRIPTYVVKPGDVLYKISTKYNILISALIKWNDLSSENDIKVGDTLYINDPDPYYYSNEQPSNLADIAEQIGVDLEKLKQWNNITHDGLVAPNSKLLILDPSQYNQ